MTIPVHARCVPVHKHCSYSHAETVSDYRSERIRQVELAEETSSGYASEMDAYLQDRPLITFKQWLIGSKR